ncbi:hypothetical protein, partial [Pseudomonas putida]|uniref:hypothetical protein n=1 Tax=Pseudomonas putida TaxID=303 RepID=UPI001E44DE9A
RPHCLSSVYFEVCFEKLVQLQRLAVALRVKLMPDCAGVGRIIDTNFSASSINLLRMSFQGNAQCAVAVLLTIAHYSAQKTPSGNSPS